MTIMYYMTLHRTHHIWPVSRTSLITNHAVYYSRKFFSSTQAYWFAWEAHAQCTSKGSSDKKQTYETYQKIWVNQPISLIWSQARGWFPYSPWFPWVWSWSPRSPLRLEPVLWLETICIKVGPFFTSGPHRTLCGCEQLLLLTVVVFEDVDVYHRAVVIRCLYVVQ